MSEQPARWRRSSHCSPSQCIEISSAGAIRDSKNPDGPVLHLDTRPLIFTARNDLVRRWHH